MVKAQTILVLMLALVAVVAGVYVWQSGILGNPTGQTVTGNVITTETGQQVIEPVSYATDQDALVAITAYDRANSNPTTTVTGVQGYVWYKDANGNWQFLLDGTALTSTTSVTSAVGTELYYAAFNDTYYGVVGKKKVTKRGDAISMETFRAANGDLSILFNGNDTQDKNVNAETVAASASNFVDEMEIQVNNSNQAFNFKGVYLTIPSATNLSKSDLSIGSPATVQLDDDWRVARKLPTSDKISLSLTSTSGLERVTGSVAKTYVVAEPIMLLQWDKLVIPKIKLACGSNDCTGQTADTVTYYVYDAQLFRSRDTNKAVELGSETDASSPADVGASDMSATLMAR